MSDQKPFQTAKDYVSAFVDLLDGHIDHQRTRIATLTEEISQAETLASDLCDARNAVQQLLDKEPSCAPPAGTVKDRVLAELNQGPLHYKELTSRLGVYESSITASLSKWHRRGVVEPKGNGVWALK